MRRALALLVLALPAGIAQAQYDGPAVESCRAFAKRELARDGNKGDVVFERDASLSIDRYTKKVGSQFVSSVLMGNGAIVSQGAASAELAFICLLADEKRPVFFYWLPRGAASAYSQCTRDSTLRAQPRPCLEHLQRVAEQDLGQAYAERFQEARERDSRAQGDVAVEAFRKANADWLRYRDAECARRRSFAPAGASADDFQLACTIDLARQRIFDIR